MDIKNSDTYGNEHITLVIIVRNRHHILEEIIQLHFGQRQHDVPQSSTVVNLLLQHCLAP